MPKKIGANALIKITFLNDNGDLNIGGEAIYDRHRVSHETNALVAVAAHVLSSSDIAMANYEAVQTGDPVFIKRIREIIEIKAGHSVNDQRT